MKCAFIFTALLSFFSAQAQQTFTGTVFDSDRSPIPGVSVHVLNSNSGAITDREGHFTLTLPPGSYDLEFTAVGYASQERTITDAASATEIILVSSSTQLDDVVVTAQKKEEALRNVPISITSLSARQVQEYRLWNTKDLTAISPNLYSANPGDNRNVTSIRGVTSTSYDPAVATYVDGVNQFSLDTYMAQLFDIQRIEVLRGPQGTLYGRNAMGGVINIITREPGRQPDGFAEVSFGGFGQQRYSAGIRAPLIKDKLFVGIAGVYEHADGFYTNQYNQSKFDRKNSLVGNYYLKYLAGSRWTINLNVKHNANRNHGAFPLAPTVSDAFQNPYTVNQNAITEMVDNVFNSSLSLAYHGQSFNFTSQTAYQNNYRYYIDPIDADFSPIDGITLIDNYGKDWNYNRAITQELRFTSAPSWTSRWKWTSGLYFFNQYNPVKQTTRFGQDAMYVGAPDTNFSIINTTKARSFGGAWYGQTTYSPIDGLDLIAGLRYDYEHKTQSVRGQYQHDPDPNPMFDTRPDTSASTSFHAVSPKFGASYSFRRAATLFGTYSRGYRVGGFTPISSDPSQPPLYPYKPEFSDNIEAGVKTSFLDDQLKLNFTMFYVSITDVQVPTLILPDAFTVTRNTGKLSNKGAELEILATLTKGLLVQYNGGFTDSHYKSLTVPQDNGTKDLSGNHQIFTPVATSMLAIQYAWKPLPTKDWALIARGEWMYLGTQYFNLANTITQPAYDLLNCRAGVKINHVDVMFWGRNLTNKKYVDYAYDFGSAHLGNPRNYGVTVRASF